MSWVNTLSNISLICLFIIVSIDFFLATIATFHPKYSKNKLLYEKLMLPVKMSIILWFIFGILWGLPIFFSIDVPINIKIGLIIFYVGAIGFGVWAVRHQYLKYKALRENSSKSSEMQKDESPSGMEKNFK